MLDGFTNTKLCNNHKLLSHNNLSFFGGGGEEDIYPSMFSKQNPYPIPFVKWGNSSYN